MIEGTHVSVDIGGRLISGRLKGRSANGAYVVISDRNGGMYYTNRPLLDHDEAAKFLSADRSLIRLLIRAGKLIPVHVGRATRLACGDFEGLVSAAAEATKALAGKPGKTRRRRRKRARKIIPKAAAGAAKAANARPAGCAKATKGKPTRTSASKRNKKE